MELESGNVVDTLPIAGHKIVSDGYLIVNDVVSDSEAYLVAYKGLVVPLSAPFYGWGLAALGLASLALVRGRRRRR